MLDKNKTKIMALVGVLCHRHFARPGTTVQQHIHVIGISSWSVENEFFLEREELYMQ
jgi:hypothetical protein